MALRLIFDGHLSTHPLQMDKANKEDMHAALKRIDDMLKYVDAALKCISQDVEDSRVLLKDEVPSGQHTLVGDLEESQMKSAQRYPASAFSVRGTKMSDYLKDGEAVASMMKRPQWSRNAQPFH